MEIRGHTFLGGRDTWWMFRNDRLQLVLGLISTNSSALERPLGGDFGPGFPRQGESAVAHVAHSGFMPRRDLVSCVSDLPGCSLELS